MDSRSTIGVTWYDVAGISSATLAQSIQAKAPNLFDYDQVTWSKIAIGNSYATLASGSEDTIPTRYAFLRVGDRMYQLYCKNSAVDVCDRFIATFSTIDHRTAGSGTHASEAAQEARVPSVAISRGPAYPGMAQWNVAGLRLGMSAGTAIAVAKARGLLGLHPKIVDGMCEKERLVRVKAHMIAATLLTLPPDGSGPCIYSAENPSPGSNPSVKLEFTEDAPAHKGHTILSGIKYSEPFYTASNDAVRFWKRLLKRYGTPTLMFTDHGVQSVNDALQRWTLLGGATGTYLASACWNSDAYSYLLECSNIPEGGLRDGSLVPLLPPTRGLASESGSGFAPRPPFIWLSFGIGASGGTINLIDGALGNAVYTALIKGESGLAGKPSF